MTGLLPPNASAFERQVESTTERTADHPVRLRDLWNPETCPAENLPWLAWAFSVDNWDSNWPETVKRRVIKNSVAVHRVKGTRGAVEDALAAVGVETRLTEWWESNPKGPPHTFSVTAFAQDNLRPDTKSIIGPEAQAGMIAAVEAAKPVRSHFTFTLGAGQNAALDLAAAQQPAQRLNARIKAGKSLHPALSLAGACAPAQRLNARIEPRGGLIHGLAVAAAQAAHTKITVHMEAS